MKSSAVLVAVWLTVSVIFLCVPAGASAISSSAFLSLAQVVQRDFYYVDSIHTVEMDKKNGGFDLIAVGSGSTRGGSGLKVEVLSLTLNQIVKSWDFSVSATDNEFGQSGPNNVDIQGKGENYSVIIQGCATHECHDGVLGFLIYYPRTGDAVKAKLVTRGLDKPGTGYNTPHYDVSYSGRASGDEKKALQILICSSEGISNKAGLPFPCK